MATETVNLDHYRTGASARHGAWTYQFPNGHEASVINDPHRPFHFEILSDDPADAATGGIAVGLTTEQVKVKLAAIHNLPRT